MAQMTSDQIERLQQALQDAAAAASPESEPSEDDEKVREVLEERARALARSAETDDAEGETLGLVVLAVGDERYGVEVQHVQEIEPLDKLTQIPGTPAFWAGVVNLRGSMYPVLDIRSYLNLGGEPEEGQKVALVTNGGLSVGLLVDEVAEIRQVRISEMGSPVSDAANKQEIVR